MAIVEFLQDNSIQTAFVLEVQAGKVRILLPNRKEQSLQENRLLPWRTDTKACDSKEEMITLLNSHIEKRKEIANTVDTADLWSMTQGEVDKAEIQWLAEVLYTDINSDTLAGLARALLQDKVHFRFSPPHFEIYPEALVEAKKQAEEEQKERERFVEGGMAWFKILLDVRQNNRPMPPCPLDNEVSARIQKLLLTRIADKDFENKDDDTLWRSIIKAIPEDPFAPMLLAMTWKIIPEHYNYWIDRADYAIEEDWYKEHNIEIQRLIDNAKNDTAQSCELQFISIDGATTKDIDDAFYLEKVTENGEDIYNLSLALACPAAFWDFNSPFNKLISQRASSLYLPEATYHMLPEILGTDVYSLVEKKQCPIFLVEMKISAKGELLSCTPSRKKATIAHNFTYTKVEEILDNKNTDIDANLCDMLKTASHLANILQEKRIENNAVIIDRPDVEIKLEWANEKGEINGEKLPHYYENVRVSINNQEEAPRAQLLVSEFMVLVNSAIALWAKEHNIPLLHRTQDIALPKEYAGVWSKAEDIARIARSLSSASFDVKPKPHAGMGLQAYAPISSPLRRYADLINEGQILYYLDNNIVLFDEENLTSLLLHLNIHLEAVMQVQRMRPRYFKLLYFKQESKKAAEKGDDYIFKGTITEEQENFCSIALTKEQIFLRAKKSFLPEKIMLGQELMLRLGKINPLKNEIQILGAEEIY